MREGEQQHMLNRLLRSSHRSHGRNMRFFHMSFFQMPELVNSHASEEISKSANAS